MYRSGILPGGVIGSRTASLQSTQEITSMTARTTRRIEARPSLPGMTQLARNPTAIDDAAASPAPDAAGLTNADFSTLDTQRITRYCRLASGIPAALIVACGLLAAWALHAFFDIALGSIWVAGVTVTLLLAGLLVYIQGMQRLRSYQLLLSAEGLIFSYGGVRTRIRLDQVQLMDLESSLLLSRFHLNRLNLHTAGGKVAISPVPEEVAQNIEQRIYGRQTSTGNAA